MSSENKWQATARDGRKVRIYAEDGVAPYPIHGAIWSERLCGWVDAKWTAEGCFSEWGSPRVADLLPVLNRRWRTCAELVGLWQSGRIKAVEFCTSGNIYVSSIAGQHYCKRPVQALEGESEDWLKAFTVEEEVVGADV
jgi:hypothetical protein